MKKIAYIAIVLFAPVISLVPGLIGILVCTIGFGVDAIGVWMLHQASAILAVGETYQDRLEECVDD